MSMNNSEGRCDSNENGSGHDSGYSGSTASEPPPEDTVGADSGSPTDPMPPQGPNLYHQLASILVGEIYLHNQTRTELHHQHFLRQKLQGLLQQQDWDLNNWARTCHTLYNSLNASRNECYEYGVLLAEAHIENDNLKKVCEEAFHIPTQLTDRV